MLMRKNEKTKKKWFGDKDNTDKKGLVVFAGALYTVTALIIVVTAWIEGLYPWDLGRTISSYISLRLWTTVLYLVMALLMITAVCIYVKITRMQVIRKIVYFMVFTCVLGCAIFPSNRQWSTSMADIHMFFAYGLMFTVTLSFALTLGMTKNRKQRWFAVLVLCYAAFFIISYVVLEHAFIIRTILIWENFSIYLLMAELYRENQNNIGIHRKNEPDAV